jgi:hypothetical protein
MKNKTNLNEIFGFGKKKNTDIKNQRSPRDRMSWETSASAFPDNLRKIKLALVDYIWDGPRLGWQSPQVQKQKQIIQSMARDCALESLQSLNKQNPNVDVSPNKVDLIAESFFVLIQRNLEKFKDLYDQKNFSGFGFHIQTLLGQALKSHTSDNRNPVPESRKNKTNLTESTQKKLLKLCNLSQYEDEVLKENVYYGEHEYEALSESVQRTSPEKMLSIIQKSIQQMIPIIIDWRTEQDIPQGLSFDRRFLSCENVFPQSLEKNDKGYILHVYDGKTKQEVSFQIDWDAITYMAINWEYGER